MIFFFFFFFFFSEKFKADKSKQIHDYLTENKRENETSEKTEFITKNIRKGSEWKGAGGEGAWVAEGVN